MLCKEFEITDKGYALRDGNFPLQEIYGLENRIIIEGDFKDDQRFYHVGYEGFPDTANCTVHVMAMQAERLRDENAELLPLKAFYVVEGDIAGGEDVLESDVLSKLINEYGWSENSSLDSSGVPVAPEPE
jgi:hypothetical protein